MSEKGRSLKSSGEGLPGFENDSSADSNPYAYPYFHCNGTSPLLFDLVVQFARHWNEMTNDDAATKMELKILVKQIQVRCKEEPVEASWRDSCGDTALHRLCQVARFPSFSSLSSQVSFARLLVHVAEALVDAHLGSATRALNNWKETPLHQFCSHCGFPNNMNGSFENVIVTEDTENPMLDLLKLLSKDSAGVLRNCWGSFALHDACGLPGWEVAGEPIWKHAQSNGSSFLNWMKQQHELMVQFLVSQNVKAVRLRVEGGQTPLHRALSSLKCSPNVIKILLSHHDTGDATLPASVSALWEHYKNFPSLDWIEENCSHVNDANVATKPNTMALNHWDSERFPWLLPEPQAQAQSLGILWESTELVLSKIALNHDGLVHACVSTTDCPLFPIQLVIRLYPEQLLQQDENGCTPLVLAICNACSGDVVNSVLRANSAAASVLDSQGRLPLCLAVASGHYSYHDTLCRLFAAEPSALTTRDPVTSLFPFALAALPTTITEQTDDDEAQLSRIYELLRIDPSVIA